MEAAGVGRPVQREVYRQGTGPALATKKSGSTDDRKWILHYNLCWDESKRNPFIFDSFILYIHSERIRLIVCTIEKRPKQSLGIITANLPGETRVSLRPQAGARKCKKI